MSKQIWNYHPQSGALLFESTADESPLEPGVYLIPAHSTTEQPPEAPEGSIVVFNKQTRNWVIEAIPEPVPEVKAEPTPAELRFAAKQKRRGILASLTVAVDDHVYQADEASQNRMLRAIMEMEVSQNATKSWIMSDNTVAEVTKDQLKAALALAVQATDNLWIIE